MLKTIIIDDNASETEALKLLLKLTGDIISVVGTAAGVNEGVALIKSAKPALVFLDVEMPDGTGFDLLKQFKPGDFHVIFTTAHRHYAIRAIRLNAIDYLQKPIDLDELRAAVQRVSKLSVDSTSGWHRWQINEKGNMPEKVGIPTVNGVLFVRLDDIEYIEADGAYTKLVLVNQKHITASRILKDFASLLEEFGFIRVHNSFLIHLKHVTAYSKKQFGLITMQGGEKIPVSRSKKEKVSAIINQLIL